MLVFELPELLAVFIRYTLHAVSSFCRAFIDQPCAAGAAFSVAATLEQALHGRLSPAPGLSDRALQEIALAPSALRFDANPLCTQMAARRAHQCLQLNLNLIQATVLI